MKKSEVFSNAVILAKHYTPKLGSKKKPGVMLYCIGGKIPNRNTISYQIANSQGFVVGKKYEVTVRELAPDEVYGRRFQFDNVGEWNETALDARNKYGEPEVFEINRNENFSTLSDNS